MHILSVDFGTSSVKLSVVDDRLNILDSAKVSYQISVTNGDWIELDGRVVFDAMLEGIRKLSRYTGSIELIGFDTFSPSMTFMDEEGNALHPVLTHLDRRSKEQTKEILRVMGKEKFQSITGIQPFTGGASVTSALWMKENRPDVFEPAYRLGHLNTYIYKRLTGVFATDPTNASMTGMYNTVTGKGWSEEICTIFGIPMEKLPPIVEAGSVLGGLRPEIAALCGLKAGIPVALGGNDAATAQVGAGNSHSGDILNISGSSEMVSILSDTPKVNDKYYLRCSATPGLWQIFAITASGFAIDWFREEFYKDMDARTFFDKEMPEVIANHLGSTEVGFLPYLAGDRQSLEPKRGAFTGLTLQATRRDFLAAIFIGIHEPILETIRLAEAFLPLNKTVKLTGGMVDDAFLSIKHRLFPGYGFEVKPDCPILGNAVLALKGLERSKSV
ncbi:MAG: sugar kinase [Oscillospiraceae bacterium]|nr:sugar kinase [Oscillospiraceae bacterium]